MLSRIVSSAVWGILVASVAVSPTLWAQERATIQATATVVSSLTVVGTNNLRFGSVTPGVNKSVDKATIGFAGEWQVNGTASAELTIGFALPLYLISVVLV